MKRELSTREKVMLLVLTVIVIALGYFKLIYEPINDQIADYQSKMEQEQTENASLAVRLAQMRKMEKAVEEIKASGEVKAIPGYDNSGCLMRELYRILNETNEYSLEFSGQTTVDGYIVLRPVSLSFQTDTYAQARAIIDALSGSENLNQISDLNIRYGSGQNSNTVITDLVITYFEVMS